MQPEAPLEVVQRLEVAEVVPRDQQLDSGPGHAPSGPDYAYAQPSLTRKKLRRLELAAGASKGEVKRGLWSTNAAMRKDERELARQGEAAYTRRSPTGKHSERRRAPARHRGAHLVGRQAAKQRGRAKPLALLFSSSSGPAPIETLPTWRSSVQS